MSVDYKPFVKPLNDNEYVIGLLKETASMRCTWHLIDPSIVDTDGRCMYVTYGIVVDDKIKLQLYYMNRGKVILFDSTNNPLRKITVDEDNTQLAALVETLMVLINENIIDNRIENMRSTVDFS